MMLKKSNLFIVTTSYSWFAVCLFISVQLFSLDVIAASSKKVDFSQLVKKSDVIVFGKCTAVTTEWRKAKIYSTATIQVESRIKGDVPPVIYVEYMGGTALHPSLNVPVTMNVSTGIDFVAGNEAVLILKQLQNNRYRVADVVRGKIEVVTDAETGEKLIQSNAKKIMSTSSAKDNSTVINSKLMNLLEFTDFVHSRLKLAKERNKP